MRSPLDPFRRLLREERAATAVEYGLVISLVVLAVVIAIAGVGSVTSGMWTNVSDEVAHTTP